MTGEAASLLISGAVLWFFSSRLLMRILNFNSSTEFFGPFIGYFSRGFRSAGKWAVLSLGFGVMLSIGFLAGGTTLGAVMLALSRGIINLDGAILMALGGSLGSALKGWYLYPILGGATPILLGMGVLLSLVFLRGRYRDYGHVFIAIGLACLGLQLFQLVLTRPSEGRFIGELLDLSANASFAGLAKQLGLGFALGLLFQSASLVLFGLIPLVGHGVVPWQGGVALLLGANLASAVPSFFSPLAGGHPDTRRLALGLGVWRLISVGIAVIYFRTHLLLTESLGRSLGLIGAGEDAPEYLVVLFNTWFHTMSMLTGWLFLPVLRRSLDRVITDRGFQTSSLGPIGERIQQLIRQLPMDPFVELDRKLRHAVRELHWVNDGIFHLGLEQVENQKRVFGLLDECLDRNEHNLQFLESLGESILDVQRSEGLSGKLSGLQKARLQNLSSAVNHLKNASILIGGVITLLRRKRVEQAPESCRQALLRLQVEIDGLWDSVFSLGFRDSAEFSRGFLAASDSDSNWNEVVIKLEAMCKVLGDFETTPVGPALQSSSWIRLQNTNPF